MRFRKLRIAWSVVCAVACVLLIVLAVRSYEWADTVGGSIGVRDALSVTSLDGQLIVASSSKRIFNGITHGRLRKNSQRNTAYLQSPD
jgi:hypothetical protein